MMENYHMITRYSSLIYGRLIILILLSGKLYTLRDKPLLAQQGSRPHTGKQAPRPADRDRRSNRG